MAVDITTAKPKTSTCQEYILYGNTSFMHMEVYFGVFAGTHTIGPFEFTNEDEQKDLDFGGIKMFQFCDGLEAAAQSMVNTAKIFVGGLGLDPNPGVMSSHVPEYQVKANLDFMCDAMEYCMEERPVAAQGLLDIDPN